MGYVYILRSKTDHKFYVGSTDNLERRVQEHNEGKSTYTNTFKPWILVFTQEYDTLLMARKVEFWLKRQKSRKLLEQIVREGIIKKTP